jgi:hypothetical protein
MPFPDFKNRAPRRTVIVIGWFEPDFSPRANSGKCPIFRPAYIFLQAGSSPVRFRVDHGHEVWPRSSTSTATHTQVAIYDFVDGVETPHHDVPIDG